MNKPAYLTLSQKKIYLDIAKEYAHDGASVDAFEGMLLEAMTIIVSRMRDNPDNFSVADSSELRSLIHSLNSLKASQPLGQANFKVA